MDEPADLLSYLSIVDGHTLDESGGWTVAAYLMADVLPDDVEAYRSSGYLEAAVRTAASHGGIYRARGGETTVLEGEWEPERMVIIEFPSMDDLLSWYRSDEYQQWAPIRQRLAPNSKIVALEGVS